MNLVDVVNEQYTSEKVAKFPAFRPGDTVAVHVRIQEGAKSRIQVFQGICIAMKNKGTMNGHFRIRKLAAGGMGVEKVFPYHSPNVVDIQLIEKGKSRRAKHFYLRDRKGKSARIAVDYDRK